MSKAKLQPSRVRRDPWQYPHQLAKNKADNGTFLLEKSQKFDYKEGKGSGEQSGDRFKKGKPVVDTHKKKRTPRRPSKDRTQKKDSSLSRKHDKKNEDNIGKRSRSLERHPDGSKDQEIRSSSLDRFPIKRKSQRYGPPVKTQVWTMGSPNDYESWYGRDHGQYDHVEAKVRSFENFDHQPGGGDVTIFDQPEKYSKQSKVGSFNNLGHVPAGGNVMIVDRAPKWKSSSKVGSLEYLSHEPRQSNVRIFHEKPKWKGKSKVGSLDNVDHQPKSRFPSIFDKPVDYTPRSKVGSLDNIEHQPKGGDVRIFHEPRYHRNALPKVRSLENINHAPGGGRVRIMNVRQSHDRALPRVGSLENIDHSPGGGDVRIFHKGVKVKSTLPKVGSLENINYQPAGGDVKIVNVPVKHRWTLPKVGSLENLYHMPGGGDVRIFNKTQKFDGTKSKVGSLDKADQPGGGNVKIIDKPTKHRYVLPKVGSLENFEYTPRGGKVKIFDEPVKVRGSQSKVGSLENLSHRAGGGNVKVQSHHVDVHHVQSRVGSLERYHYQPGGGGKKIFSEKLRWNAQSKVGSLESREDGEKIPWRTQSMENLDRNSRESMLTDRVSMRSYQGHLPNFKHGVRGPQNPDKHLYHNTHSMNINQVKLKPIIRPKPATDTSSNQSSEPRMADLGYQPKGDYFKPKDKKDKKEKKEKKKGRLVSDERKYPVPIKSDNPPQESIMAKRREEAARQVNLGYVMGGGGNMNKLYNSDAYTTPHRLTMKRQTGQKKSGIEPPIVLRNFASVGVH